MYTKYCSAHTHTHTHTRTHTHPRDFFLTPIENYITYLAILVIVRVRRALHVSYLMIFLMMCNASTTLNRGKKGGEVYYLGVNNGFFLYGFRKD